MANTSDHILCNVYMKNIKLQSLCIHWYYSYQNTLELCQLEISQKNIIHIFFSSFPMCPKMLLHTTITA